MMDTEVLETLMEGRRVEGALRWNTDLRCIQFRAYNRKPRQQQLQTIYESENGWLKASVKRLKMQISTKRRLGNKRCAMTMMNEAKEMITLLYNMEEE